MTPTISNLRITERSDYRAAPGSFQFIGQYQHDKRKAGPRLGILWLLYTDVFVYVDLKRFHRQRTKRGLNVCYEVRSPKTDERAVDMLK